VAEKEQAMRITDEELELIIPFCASAQKVGELIADLRDSRAERLVLSAKVEHRIPALERDLREAVARVKDLYAEKAALKEYSDNTHRALKANIAENKRLREALGEAVTHYENRVPVGGWNTKIVPAISGWVTRDDDDVPPGAMCFRWIDKARAALEDSHE